jgi:hypothetical protein
VSLRSALVFAVALAAMLAPWPMLPRAFGAVFSTFGNVVAAVLGPRGDAGPRFSLPARGRATSDDGGDWAVQLCAADDAQPPLLLDTRILGYTPVAVLLAIAVASGLPRRRRMRVLSIAAGLVAARTALAISLSLARAFGDADGWASGRVGELLWFSLITPPALSYATPLLAWWLGFALTTSHVASADERARRPRSRGALPGPRPPSAVSRGRPRSPRRRRSG